MVLSRIESLLRHNRFVAVTSAASELNEISLRRLSGTERLGEPFLYEVKLASRNPVQNFATIPGQSLTIGLKLKDSQTRFFNGVVTRFQYLGLDDTEHLNYVAQVRPWISLLEHRSNSRVFQNKTSIEIITTIFREHKGNFKNQTARRFPERPYCVQYDETDLAFVSRLMEQDGIYYYFEHAEDQHDLVLVDNAASHMACTPEIVETHHNLRPARSLYQEDVILHWDEVVSLQPNKVVLRDYDHEKPMAELTSVARVPPVRTGGIPPRKLTGSAITRPPESVAVRTGETSSGSSGCTAMREVFEYPGHYTKKSDGDFYATIRAEELACNAYRARIESTARQITTGSLFKAANPFYYGQVGSRPKPTDRFLAVGQDFTVIGEVGDDLTADTVGGKGERFLYHSNVEIIPATTQYRPRRRTSARLIHGPQTAVVVGPEGESIATDKYGRVKVQFFWDREGEKNENSSCWIRVAQNFAGKGFGNLVVPRIGHEVVVDFIHGNPDTPLVTGVVYNGSNLPPETLPTDKTRSTFRTHTDGGAANAYNELRFEDKQGREEVYLKAQKNHTVEVGNIYSIDVKRHFLLTSGVAAPASSAAAALGSRVEVTPDKIRLVVSGRTGPQAIEISADGIAIIGTMIGVMATPPRLGSIVSMPPPTPGPPTPSIMKLIATLGLPPVTPE
ncbi:MULTISPECIES: type VI secretion system Vgr family protein [Rhizobium]|uniref:Type VI secretion system secreted protein VgrG n=1 Tax=Rhizobium lentis TaxID=1138194 RepID=A0A7W8XJ83_9HYPH|nr:MULTISPECIES: type VI secretion system tip protein TssI/VgrG [Rhizobium]MBB4577286.1 type VI secretion system secreted protein VgrG [Rhizobium lentis]MBB5553899.1 type VI secretion system secreted protein VgrG [Rhizobium lentis]MBB5563841.1 type VI secretion system secreted protein VgrG [Rhizobium lentis]MBB5570891.1 type VI secretion system secreted protein VgrG [Rhizobium lentis]PCK83581.1 type VI secretion system tip protein VgrG [Rhizobium sophoriradicis]